jgi:hypothetical protein
MYAIMPRHGWKTPTDLQLAAERSGRIGNEEIDEILPVADTVVVRTDPVPAA